MYIVRFSENNISMDEKLYFLIQDSFSAAQVSCTFPEKYLF